MRGATSSGAWPTTSRYAWPWRTCGRCAWRCAPGHRHACRAASCSPPRWWARPAPGAGYPALRLATALATLGFVVTMGFDAFGSRLMALPMARSAAAPAMEMAAVSEVSEDEALQKEPAPEAPAPAEPELPADSLAQSEAAPGLRAAAATPTVAGTAAPEGRTSEDLEATAVAGLTAPNELQTRENWMPPKPGWSASEEAPAFWARLFSPPFQPTLRSAEAILGTVVLVLAWLISAPGAGADRNCRPSSTARPVELPHNCAR